jgi:site-specific DNA recombinase
VRVYTRKSTEHNLDLEFNSLDAQRESCEAYIKSQMHEGWHLIPARYDDGGISGASLDRPDLQRLISDIKAGRVDNVVVYKVDRLTRSLTDFAKLVELFDAHKVSFVSVTQAFNTTNSMGRLTLNVLLSFAQFEREVIAERVRDKVAASKAKGLWMGGNPPLGYINRNKKLVFVPDEAVAVRGIFQSYLELGSIGALLQKLDQDGIMTKRRVWPDGRVTGGCRFGPGSLGYVLRNRCYVGEIAHKGHIHPADHEPILDRELFEAVQAQLRAGAVTRILKHAATAYLLKGRLYDSAGNRMTPSHSVKKKVRYRYYVSQAILASRPKDVGRIGRVPAPELEGLVETYLRQQFGVPGQGKAASELVDTYLERAVIMEDVVEIQLTTARSGQSRDEGIIRLPWTKQPSTAVKGAIQEANATHTDSRARENLLTAIGKAMT